MKVIKYFFIVTLFTYVMTCKAQEDSSKNMKFQIENIDDVFYSKNVRSKTENDFTRERLSNKIEDYKIVPDGEGGYKMIVELYIARMCNYALTGSVDITNNNIILHVKKDSILETEMEEVCISKLTYEINNIENQGNYNVNFLYP